MPDLAAQAASDNVVVAAVQMEPTLFDVAANLEAVLTALTEQAAAGAGLVVFPECALNGYVMASREEAEQSAEPIPGPSTERILAACHELNVYAVVGLLEQAGDHCYNSAILAGPEGLVAKHRKAHLPGVGVDRYVDPGDIPFAVHQTTIGRIGMLICYDLSFPEALRCLALDGLEILAHPTNSPTGTWGAPGSRPEPERSDPKARGELVIIASADRCGVERGVEFVGGSRIAGPSGRILARADTNGPTAIRATVHPSRTRSKHVVLPHIGLEVDYHKDRRPDLYGRLVEG